MKTLAEIKAECERQFQNGGPKVCYVTVDNVVKPSYASPAQSVRRAWDEKDRVFARTKVGTSYQWQQHFRGGQPSENQKDALVFLKYGGKFNDIPHRVTRESIVNRGWATNQGLTVEGQYLVASF